MGIIEETNKLLEETNEFIRKCEYDLKVLEAKYVQLPFDISRMEKEFKHPFMLHPAVLVDSNGNRIVKKAEPIKFDSLKELYEYVNQHVDTLSIYGIWISTDSETFSLRCVEILPGESLNLADSNIVIEEAPEQPYAD